jgi:DNA-directed RNA polymerase specialized sigma subunit
MGTDVRDVLRSAVLHELLPLERLLVVLWYVERMCVAEIAITLDMTELQVARTHGLVLAKLRRELDGV